MRTATLLLVSLSSLATPAAAQTYVSRAEATGYLAGAGVASDGSVAVAWTDASRGHVAVFGATGSLTSSLELAPSSGTSVRLMGATFTPSGALLVHGDVDSKPWVANIDPTTGATLWDHTSGETFGYFRSVTVLSDGRILAAGSLEVSFGDPETLTALFDAQGTLLWQRYYTDPSGYDWAYDVQPASDGGAWLTGFFYGGLRVTRLTPGASLWTQWQKEYSGPTGLYEASTHETADGGLVLAGLTEPQDDVYRVFAMKLDASGDVEWSHSYPSYDLSFWDADVMTMGGVVELPGGDFVVAASQSVPAPVANQDLVLLRLDAQGQALSYRNLGVPGDDDKAISLTRTPDGTLVLGSWIDDLGPRIARVTPGLDSGLACLSDTPVPVATLPFTPSVQPTIWGFQTESETFPQEHTLPAAWSTSAWQECANLCEVDTVQFGVGLAGTGGIAPTISGTDGFCVGKGPEVRVTNALGGSVGFFGFSFQPAALPVLGGWVWVDPVGLITHGFVLDGAPGAPGAGGTLLQISTDLSPFVGVQIHGQAFVLDPGAVQGISMTGGLTLDVE